MIGDLDPGRYEAWLRHPSFQEKRFFVNLGASDGAVEIVLLPKPAVLSVVTSFSDDAFSEVDIEIHPAGEKLRSVFLGLKRYNTRVSGVELAAGQYDVTIRSPYHQPWSTSVDLAPGESREIKAELTVDLGSITKIREEVERTSRSGSSRRLEQMVKVRRSLQPSDPEPLARLAMAQFASRDFVAASSSGKAVFELGGSLTFTVQHHHNAGYEPHPARITIGPDGFSYATISAPCNASVVRLPLSQLTFAGMSGAGDSGNMLTVRISDPRNPRRDVTLSFADERARFQKDSRSLLPRRVVETTPEGRSALETISDLISSARQVPMRVAEIQAPLPTPQLADVPYLIRGEQVVDLEAVRGKVRTRGSGGEVTVPGSTSPIVVDAGETAFAMRSTTVGPETLVLYRLHARSGSRFLLFGLPGVEGPTAIRLRLERSGDVYRLTTSESLSAGEYCLSRFGSEDAYCFSIRGTTGHQAEPPTPSRVNPRVVTRFAVKNETWRLVVVYLDDSEVPITVRPGLAHIDQLEVGSSHILRAVVNGRSFRTRFTVPQVMRSLRVTESGIRF